MKLNEQACISYKTLVAWVCGAVLWSCRAWAEGRSPDGWGWAASGACDCGCCAAWTSAHSSPDAQCCWETWDTTDASNTHTNTHTHDQICVRSLYLSIQLLYSSVSSTDSGVMWTTRAAESSDPPVWYLHTSHYEIYIHKPDLVSLRQGSSYQ